MAPHTRVGVLGGSFDPPHLGHLGAAENALDAGQVDTVWLIPCLRHPLGKIPAPFEKRLEMCRLMVAGNERICVSDLEAEIGGEGHTVSLLEVIRRRHPSWKLRLILGSDIYHEREKWHRFDLVETLAPPLWVARTGIAPIPEPTIVAPALVSSSELRSLLARGVTEGLPLNPGVLNYIRKHRLYGAN